MLVIKFSPAPINMDPHPKFIARWAEIYVDKILQNKVEAQEWARRFLAKEDVDAVAAEAKKILIKKGYKVTD